MNNRQRGAVGEELALNYLLKDGYKYIDKNWHYSRSAEIDLIMQKDKTIVFVEVKTRSNLNYGHPFEAITQTKMQNIKTVEAIVFFAEISLQASIQAEQTE